MTHIDRTLLYRTVLAALLLSGIMVAQTKPSLQTRPAAKPAASAEVTTVLPTEETVNSFLFQMLGYDPPSRGR